MPDRGATDSRARRAGYCVTLSFGDLVRQSGYRTRVLAELFAFDLRTPLEPVLIVFDRDWRRAAELALNNISCRAHSRFGAARLLADFLSLSKRQPIRLVHAHNLYSAALALWARPLFGYKVILDLHGRIPEEFVRLGKGGNLSRSILERLEHFCVRRADHIVGVSNALTAYLSERYRIPTTKLSVIPMCADTELFRWNTTARAQIREKLSLNGRMVCVHLGSFLTWYDPELTVSVFRSVRQRYPEAHLLIVTEEAKGTKQFLQARLPEDQFTILSVPHSEVPDLLAAADLGLLLLRSTPNIQVSSPTKFAEYLNSGLPVLITSGVGDFSRVVAESGTGRIVDGDGRFDMSIVDELLKDREATAFRSTTLGKDLTWQAFQPTWDSLVESLLQA